LRDALRAAGHEAEIVAIPFKWYPPERILDQMLACRLLDLTETAGVPVDLVIGLKFPAYLIPHPNKVLWILHQHRQAYDLWDHALNDLVLAPNGAKVREAIHRADRKIIPEAKAVYSNSANVTARLKKYCGIDSTPLYHPPQNAQQFFCAKAEDYLFFPSRLWPSKRQAMVLEALAHTSQPVRARFAGVADNPAYAEELRDLSRKLKVERRVLWLGQISEEEKHRQYAHALGVIFPPVDEDYGYVTLEGMLASKPVISCTDSGGPLEFVLHEETGLIAEPTPTFLSQAMDVVWRDRAQARRWGEAGNKRYHSMGITWPQVVRKLLS
jgi:glycosyltransferase involved in cell wall biosynthesis